MANPKRGLKEDKLRQQVQQFLLKHPIVDKQRGCYDLCADEFNISTQRVRRIYRTLKKKGIKGLTVPALGKPMDNKISSSQFRENASTGEADLNLITDKTIKNLDDLVKVCNIDLKTWRVTSWEVTKWEVGRKDKLVNWNVENGVANGKVKDTGKIFVQPLFRVNAKLSRRNLDNDIHLQKEALIKEIKAYTPKYDESLVKRLRRGSVWRLNPNRLLEIAIFDPHFGKLAWREETNEDYDIKIAEKRVKQAIKELLEEVDLQRINRILLPLGNDLINIDNSNKTTFAGTPQDTDARFAKIIRIVRRVLVEVITDLSLIAPVDVLIVPGNHDITSAFMMGEILDAFFANNPRVKIDNSPKLRKYYQFGKVGFQFTHGNEERHDSLGLLFATEEPRLWADTYFRFAQLGHLHKNKKINYVSVDENLGFQIQIIPSLSGTDAWHFKKGYGNLKQAKAFVFDPEEGMKGEYTTTVNIGKD